MCFSASVAMMGSWVVRGQKWQKALSKETAEECGYKTGKREKNSEIVK